MLSLLLLYVVLCTCTGGSAGLVLQYFDAKGVIETARVLARVGGLNMEDVRYSIKVKEGGGFETPEFTAAKVSGALAPNMDRAPLLKIGDDCTIGQSRAIERYIARRCNLYGSSDEEAAVIDCVVENTRDIKVSVAQLSVSEDWCRAPSARWHSALQYCPVLHKGPLGQD